MNFKEAVFIKSAALFERCVPDLGKEVAFVGRSNAGKSSALNTLVGHPIARVSKLPGRTQLINFFGLDDTHRLVDLPGYGYARVTDEIKRRWKKNLTRYCESRESLVGVVLLCDVRHLLKEQDAVLIEWVLSANKPVHILLTKADKLSKNEALRQLKAMKESLEGIENVSVQLFSALSHQGLEGLEKQLCHWFFPE